MNKVHIIIILCALSVHGYVRSGSFLDLLKTENKQKLFIGIIEEKQKQKEELQKEREELLATDKDFEEKIAQQVQEIKTQLSLIEAELKKNPDDEFLLKKQALLKESETFLKDAQRIREDITSLLDEFITQLSGFLADPDFEGVKKKYKLQERLYYSFEDLQSLHELILDQERLITQLNDQHKSSVAEKESRKRTAAATQEEYEKKKHEMQLLMETAISDIGFGLSAEHEKELMDIDEKEYTYKKQLDTLKIQEINYRITFIECKLFLAKTYLDLFKKQLRAIKPSIHVSEADVALAEEELAKEQQAFFTRKDSLLAQREKIATMQKTQEKELATLSKQLNLSLGRDLDEWSIKPRQTSQSYVAVAQLGTLNDHVLELAREKDFIDVQIILEQEKFNYKKIRTEGKKTYNKMSTRGFLSEEEITKERGEYDSKKRDVEEALKLYQSKINASANLLNQQKKVLDNIAVLHDDAQRQLDGVFKGKAREYTLFTDSVTQAENYVKKQRDIVGKITTTYSGIVAELNATMRLIDFISTELQTNTIWYRPAYAITPEGVKNIMSDTNAFFNDVRLYLMQFNTAVFIARIKEIFSHPFSLLSLIGALLVLMVVLMMLKRYELHVIDIFLVKGQRHAGLVRIGSFIIGTVLTFIALFSVSIFVWITLWLLCWIIADSYLYIVLYLFSIPYLVYLSHRFMKLLIKLNKEHDYVLFPHDYQRRFEIVCSMLLFISISIFFFRQAFMLSSIYLRSELPNILLAVNFIVLQISLIFLITKEQIIGIIPEQTEFWRWVRAQVDQYYYLILLSVIAIIVMSNPYVGFGRLVLYLLSGFIYTILLLKVLLLMHECVKYAASHIFFFQDEAIVRERFAYAKTCLGLMIIASFVILSFIGFIVAAKIWGWEITLLDIKQWLARPILLEDTTHPVSTLSLLKIILYVLGGLVAAYALKQYVLARIFDLLLVESGVQHTVTSIVQYAVIVIAIFIGFKSVGLGALVGYVFTALALSIGLYIKDPISDFVSYFIILVQRPVKIGDYVEIDNNTLGVVRKITPRSVVLRRKNSTTIIVPNSYVVSRAIENWNYVRNFIALNDIILLISYKDDPQQVKELLHKAIEEYPHALKNPRHIIRLNSFTEFGYEFMVRVFISSAYTLEMWDMASDVRLLIAKAFRENDIEFAIPLYKVEDIYNKYEQHITEPTPLRDSNKIIRE